jgi:hypothetical protein
MSPRALMIFLAAAVLATVAAVSLDLRTPPSSAAATPDHAPAVSPRDRASRPVPRQTERTRALLAMLPVAAAAPDEAAAADVARSSPSPAIEAMDAVYDTTSSPKEIADALARLIPAMPPEDQAEAVHYLVYAVTDEDYSPAARLLLAGVLGTEAQQILLENLAQRPAAVSAPIWQTLAQRPQHPLQAAALDRLAEQEASASSKSSDPR